MAQPTGRGAVVPGPLLGAPWLQRDRSSPARSPLASHPGCAALPRRLLSLPRLRAELPRGGGAGREGLGPAPRMRGAEEEEEGQGAAGGAGPRSGTAAPAWSSGFRRRVEGQPRPVPSRPVPFCPIPSRPAARHGPPPAVPLLLPR